MNNTAHWTGHEDLRDPVREVLADQCSLRKVLDFAGGDLRVGTTLWRSAAELGWLGLGLPEAYGGSGLGLDALAVLNEELGRHLAPVAFLPTMLCAEALVAGASESQRRKYLPRIIAGEVVGAISVLPDFGGRVTVSQRGGAMTLNGDASALLCGQEPALLLFFAKDDQGRLCALLLDLNEDEVEVRLHHAGDLTRGVGSLQLREVQVPAERLIANADAGELAARLLRHACLAVACDSLGGGSAIHELTLDHLKTRRQFGRPIGSFQALKHRCADLKTALEIAASAVMSTVEESAGWLSACETGPVATPAGLHMSKFLACDTYARVAGEAVQLHGGIGFTWEHPCHLFLKRAKLNQQLFGRSEWHRDQAGRLLMSAAKAA